MSNDALLRLEIPELTKVKSGKVREVFDMGEHFLFVASDRISAFDWDMESTSPALRDDIVSPTRTKYIETFEPLVGETFPGT